MSFRTADILHHKKQADNRRTSPSSFDDHAATPNKIDPTILMPQFEMRNPSTELPDSIRDVDCEHRSSDAQHFRQWKQNFANPIVSIQ
jgi:hypothetical protein